jgi:aspartate kinase
LGIIVQKFGGSSVANAERVMNVAQRVVDTYKDGNSVVVVVSAQGDTTDLMIAKAMQINRHRAAREMDAYLAAGEQMSAGLLAMAIGALGCGAVSLTGWQAGIQTDGNHGNARIRHINTCRLRKELSAGKIVVVSGFQGVDDDGDITTLGRGGSDTTAVALAAYLQADKCQIFTDVDGIYDRDPRVFKDAVKFQRISYEKMMALIENGAQVLHDRSVEFARDYGIAVEVLSSATGAPGTVVAGSE